MVRRCGGTPDAPEAARGVDLREDASLRTALEENALLGFLGETSHVEQGRRSIFVSYSHKDTVWLEELRPHLVALAREKQIEALFWDDTLIRPGSNWRDEIDQALSDAGVAVLIVSKHFLASEFITTQELPRLLAAAKARKATILPLVVSACRYEHHLELRPFQTVNSPEEPLEGMPKARWEAILVRVTELADQALSPSAPAPPSPVEPAVPAPPRRAGAPAARKKRPSAAKPAPPVRRTSPDLSPPVGEWDRVVVQSLADGTFQFQLIRDRHRLEATIGPPQLRLLDRLADACLAHAQWRPDAAAALFQLLLPSTLKPVLFQGTGTLLVLDSSTARYPWELMLDPASPGVEPIAVRHSLVRHTVSDRVAPGPAAGVRRALVIGNPQLGHPSKFVDLPGAALEARQIADLLEASGYQVKEMIDYPAVEIIVPLLSQGYEVLHLTGHGDFDGSAPAEQRPATGFVIGEDLRLTATEVRQMHIAPDIVFLNGSYLGRHGAAGSNGSARFAASLPDEFIAIGTRAVLAPLGDISDNGAIVFATTLYARMLEGRTLGEALLAARRAVWTQHPGDASWGSYLCYGDPGYRLTPAAGGTR
jgi:CHAT domain/TIR domain